MAESLLRYMHPEIFEAYSAGVGPQGINPLTAKVMKEIGIDISGQRSKHVKELIPEKFNIVITVCSGARNNCPVFPGETKTEHWDIYDPASFRGTEEEKMQKFRDVRDMIKEKIRSFAGGL